MNVKRAIACGLGLGAVAFTCRNYVGNADHLSSTKNPQLEITRTPFVDRFSSSLKINKVLASWTDNVEPSTKWDYNWDRRDPESLLHAKKREKLEGKDLENELIKLKPKATRYLYFIRHGQYEIEEDTDENRVLTKLGREQAHLTGKRLKELGHNYTVMVNSTMSRAKETADIISEHVVTKEKRESCDLIREGAPYPPEPGIGSWRPNAAQFFTDGSRIEAGFRKHLHRASASQTEDSHEVIVCHANVIRYYFCRALQLPPEAWLRIGLNNGSITMITIRPNGRVSVRSLGDTGHMPPEKISIT